MVLSFSALDHDKSPPSVNFVCTNPSKLNENQGLWRPNLCELCCCCCRHCCHCCCYCCFLPCCAAAAALLLLLLLLLLLPLLLLPPPPLLLLVCCCWCWCYLFALLLLLCCWLLAPAQNLPASTFRPPPSPQVSDKANMTLSEQLNPAARNPRAHPRPWIEESKQTPSTQGARVSCGVDAHNSPKGVHSMS